MKKMELPKMSTDKPKHIKSKNDIIDGSDYLEQQFKQSAPNLVWVSDITYLKTGGKWYYLCVFIDSYSRKIISWDISSKGDTQLVMNTFKKGYRNRNILYSLIFHSDRGTQYTAKEFRKLLDEFNIIQSFSKKGYPFDNAASECFLSILKRKKQTGEYITILMN